MNLHHHPDSTRATLAAADWLVPKLLESLTRNLMVAGGNTPLALYAEIARRQPPLARLNVFALDEYVGVPPTDPRTCANLLRRSVVEAWGIPPRQYRHFDWREETARREVNAYEAAIASAGGLDVMVLGLGRNGHLGFNEPGSARDSTGRVLELEASSTAANREWFGGDYAPARGVTVGLRTILSARTVLVLAFGTAKADAVHAMVDEPPDERCPASWLQRHPAAHVFLDRAAASRLNGR